MNGKVLEPVEIEPRILHCPFNHTNCIQKRCALYINLTVNEPSSIAGIGRQTVKQLCVFVALLEINILTLNKPPMMLQPGQIPNSPIRGK